MTPHPALRTKLASALALVRSHDGDVAGAIDAPLDAALEALALCAVAGVTGGLDDLSAKERRAAVASGARLLLTARAAATTDDSLHVSVSLAADGLAALRGRPAASHGVAARSSTTRSPLHPSPSALIAMTRGDPDALAAALVAAHTRSCEHCRASLDVATLGVDDVSATGTPLLRVAASTATVRSPADGRTLARLKTPSVEAVLFDDDGTRRLAVYGDARVALRLVADGVSTEDQLPGYWLGRVDDGVTRLAAVLHAGDAQVAWKLSLR